MQVSIIIPTLEEGGGIASQVERCLSLSPRPEVIVADGGSRDDTRSRAAAAGARVVSSPRPGRAFQMNAGGTCASGEVLLFLHADVILDQRAYAMMLRALDDPALSGGAFRRRFDSSSRLLLFGCRLADLRGRWIRVFLGDQAIFVRRAAFHSLGGYPEILLFEDLEFSRRLARRGKTALLEGMVIASSRRFHREGTVGQLCKNLYLTALFLAGADPARLARRYDPRFHAPLGAGPELRGEQAESRGERPPGAEAG